ncbi:hypothetical protein A5740_13610 [Mycobacterium sp. GA-1841]|uniref:hypothetical protein n=1 Tax=Mycobacterium sp. GA-1841 TaxID=1834154 RepID=UPI00096D723A|nr:hypothetical protein [Mycobacterium sp. GA-1841]OMC32154.1 hypothetical protein A5740_13610 [Mycobacterium sp. GA-1841]
MAVRPLVTTGAALLSAGALVAATPALFVPRDQMTIAAPVAAAAPAKLTQEQINLLALSLQGAWQSFTQGYGGIWFPGEDDDGNAVEGDCTLEGAVCQKGFTGLAYYLSDTILPLGDLDNIFFEGGFTELAHQAVRTVAVAIDAVDPTGRLDLTRRVDDFFEGGATQLVGNLLLDNLPQDGYAYGVTNSLFFGYGDNTGIYATFTYIVDAIAQGTPTPEPNLINPFTAEVQTQQLDESTSDTTLLARSTASAESGAGSTGLPNFSKLPSLPMPKLDAEVPWKRLTEKVDLTPPSKLAEDVDGEDQNKVDENAEPTPVVNEPVKSETPTLSPPKFTAPKVPELKLPELKLDAKPQFKAHIKAKDHVNTDDTESGSKDVNTGVDTSGGNKVTPPVLFGDGEPKGESNGSKFLKNLAEAVNGVTGGKDAGSGSGKTDDGEK